MTTFDLTNLTEWLDRCINKTQRCGVRAWGVEQWLDFWRGREHSAGSSEEGSSPILDYIYLSVSAHTKLKGSRFV